MNQNICHELTINHHYPWLTTISHELTMFNHHYCITTEPPNAVVTAAPGLELVVNGEAEKVWQAMGGKVNRGDPNGTPPLPIRWLHTSTRFTDGIIQCNKG